MSRYACLPRLSPTAVANRYTVFFIIPYFVLLYSWMYRVALRCPMVGAEFRWINQLNSRLLGQEQRAFIAGNGMDGHFLVIFIIAVFALALLYLLIAVPARSPKHCGSPGSLSFQSISARLPGRRTRNSTFQGCAACWTRAD